MAAQKNPMRIRQMNQPVNMDQSNLPILLTSLA